MARRNLMTLVRTTALAVALFHTTPSRALSLVPSLTTDADSLDYQIAKATAVLRVRVTEQFGDEYRITVLDKLKGAAPPSFIFKKYSNPFPPRPLADGHEFLIIATSSANDSDPGRWDLQVAIPLDGAPLNRTRPLFWMDGTPAAPASREHLLAAARAAIAAGAPPGWDRPAYVHLPAAAANGWQTVLRIPFDTRTEALALRWAAAPETHRRLAAVQLLCKLDTPASADALRRLLADEAVDVRQTSSGDREIYHVRLAAFAALRNRQIPGVTEPRIEVTPWPVAYLIDHGLGISAIAAALLIPPLAFTWIARRREDNARYHEPPSFAVRVGSLTALLFATLAGALAWYWVDSRGHGATFARIREDNSVTELSSVGGRLALVWIGGLGQGFSTADWGAKPIDFENEMKTSPDFKSRAAIWGFAYGHAKRSAGDRLTFVQAPYWSLVTAAAIPPALWLRRQIRAARRRRRAQSGRCITCGYDLRQTPDRCPECGHPPPNARPSYFNVNAT